MHAPVASESVGPYAVHRQHPIVLSGPMKVGGYIEYGAAPRPVPLVVDPALMDLPRHPSRRGPLSGSKPTVTYRFVRRFVAPWRSAAWWAGWVTHYFERHPLPPPRRSDLDPVRVERR